MFARDIMDTWFHAISPGDTIAEAVGAFRKASQAEKKTIFGLIVTDDPARFWLLMGTENPRESFPRQT